MSIELRPLGIKCNISCVYCYQNMHRDVGNGYSTYDFAKVKRKLEESGQPFHLFGGEPLLMPVDQLTELLKWEYDRHGSTSLLTNGVLITDAHIDMFKNFNTSIGISIDGPEELNDIRWAGTLTSTREATAATILNINKLVQHNIIPGLQLQVSKCNSVPTRLPKMFDWLRKVDELGISTARLHILEIDNPVVRSRYAFTPEENIEVFNQYLELEKTLKNLRFDIFKDMKNMLLAEDEESTCTWRACDPYTTEAVSGMDGQGRLSNCGLTDKEGINFQKPEKPGYERYIALYHTPKNYGGCQGCRFFLACKGQCPGAAIDSDWRNKSENCAVWMHFYDKLERELLSENNMPVSVHPERQKLENEMIAQWSSGLNPTLRSLIDDLTLRTA